MNDVLIWRQDLGVRFLESIRPGQPYFVPRKQFFEATNKSCYTQEVSLDLECSRTIVNYRVLRMDAFSEGKKWRQVRKRTVEEDYSTSEGVRVSIQEVSVD
jgi:hypothetical protein